MSRAKTRESRKLSGTFRHDRDRPASTPVPALDAVPEAPEWLPPGAASDEFHRAAALLHTRGALTAAALPALAHYAALHGKLSETWSRGDRPPTALLILFRRQAVALGLAPAALPAARPIAPRTPLGMIEAMCGEPLPEGANPFLVHAPLDLWRERWAQYGAEALAHWTHPHPGTRPPTWWRYVACEPRRVLDNGTRRIESEAAFLKRMGLLLPGEARRLRAVDFEPAAQRG